MMNMLTTPSVDHDTKTSRYLEAIGPNWLILICGSHISIRFPQLRTHQTYFLTCLANSDGPIITNPPNLLSYMSRRAYIFLRICTHTQTITITINSDLCPPMPIHSMTYAHPCYSNCVHVLKICEMCITHLHQVLVGSDK
jgi:hypothetical protein